MFFHRPVGHLDNPVHSWVKVLAILGLTPPARPTVQHHHRGAGGVAGHLPVDGVHLRHLQHPGGVRLSGWVEYIAQLLRCLPQDRCLAVSPSHPQTLKDQAQAQVKVRPCHLQLTGRASCKCGRPGQAAPGALAGQLAKTAQAQMTTGHTACQAEHPRDKTR